MASSKKSATTRSAIPNGLQLALLIFIPIQFSGASFAYDFPQIFESLLIERMNISTFQVELLYSLGSLPNLVANIAGSLIISGIGIQLAAVIFHAILFIGAAVTLIAVRNNSYSLLLTGRIFIGVSFDLTFLVQQIACERWFSGSK